MAVVDALRKRGGDGGGSRAPVSKEKLRRAARTALEQIEEALGEGDSKRAKELTGVLRDMVQLCREVQGGGSRELVVRFEGETDDAAQ